MAFNREKETKTKKNTKMKILGKEKSYVQDFQEILDVMFLNEGVI